MSILRVRAHLTSPVATTEEIHLEGIALWAHPDLRGRYAQRSTAVADLAYPPISIHRLRACGLGLYLSSSWLIPDRQGGRERFTKRLDSEDVERMAAPYTPGAGPAKHYCLPVYTIEAPIVEWLICGRRAGLKQLLRYVQQIGTHRRQGYGVVSRWEVECVEGLVARDVILEGGRARRFLPAAWTTEGEADDEGAVIPPFWHPGLRLPRVRPGTPCTLHPEVLEALAQCA